jgi:hypothetical protein
MKTSAWFMNRPCVSLLFWSHLLLAADDAATAANSSFVHHAMTSSPTLHVANNIPQAFSELQHFLPLV